MALVLFLAGILAGTMADFEDDPLESCFGGPPQAKSQPVRLTLTEPGIRALLGRKKVRSRPLLQLTCCGCGRTTWDMCRFVPGAFIEWFPEFSCSQLPLLCATFMCLILVYQLKKKTNGF